ncbi:MAG: DUF4175 domain-containing protein [Myxococcota bacterium]|nr:DUF4175 domain-containing protein [Myxococcota bacterium]
MTQPLLQLAEGWRSATRAPRWRVTGAIVTLVGVLAFLLARNGTAKARLAATVVMALTVAAAAGWSWLERRRLHAPEDIVRALVRRVDRERADRAVRAMSLVGPKGEVRDGGISPELARLHVARAIAQLPAQRVLQRAGKLASRLRLAALAAGACVVALLLANGWSVFEGADVLLARDGAAPFAMRWLDDVEVVTRPPEYLHEEPHEEASLRPLALPFGTAITVRGKVLHAGRRLLLSDGNAEVPFVDDGKGAVVARWSLAQSTRLHVAARFGGVVIDEPDALRVESIPDRSPSVILDGAPRQVVLVEQSEDIPIKYEASDDHGLREVHLVLRSGTREERRVLARFDGETRSDRGGQVLTLRDPFVKKSHAPVEVTVEAKDNDPLMGPKWGTSAAISLVPPDVGEPEARRFEAIRELRDALVDSLAWRLATPVPAGPTAGSLLVAARKRAEDDGATLRRVLSDTYAGVHVPSRIRSILLAQEQKTRKALDAERRAPSISSRTEAIKASERFTLIVDAVLRGLGVHDAKESSRELADSADDLAVGASQAESEETRQRGLQRMDAATAVLSGGGRALRRLGSLGRDLGEIVDADLLRVKRARDGADFVHAELAARDLATRLHDPDPSFGTRGGQRAGSESGGARGTPGDEGEASDDVDQAFNEAAQDLERLARDHADEIGQMERALAGAASEEERDRMLQEARRHADAIRDAARGLPMIGTGSDSWTSKGAAARELAEQMSQSLEQGRPGDAVQSGRSAVGSLDEARKMLQRGGWMEDPSGEALGKVEQARRKLESEEKWSEGQLVEMRKRAAERARGQLGQGGDEEEKLAERAHELAQRGRDHAPLPQPAIESIDAAERAAHQAAQALKQGDADHGLERQREAQRDLEAASQALQGDDDEGSRPPPKEGDARRPNDGAVAIPGPNEHKSPEEFRRRVVRGLGETASGGMKDAVHRYAEGLLR